MDGNIQEAIDFFEDPASKKQLPELEGVGNALEVELDFELFEIKHLVRSNPNL